MEVERFLDNIHSLSDLELAVLLSLIAQENCLITTADDAIDDLALELALIASEVFRLSYAVVSSEDQISVDKFGEAILNQSPDHDFGRDNSSPDELRALHSQLANTKIRAASFAPSQASYSNLDSRIVANVVIAKNFNHASQDVQIAALELNTRRRIYSRTTVHQVPKTFILIPLISDSSKQTRLNPHLSDRISISHHHDPTDGFANLEDLESHSDVYADNTNEDKFSTNSYPRSQSSHRNVMSRHIDQSVIEQLRVMGANVAMTPEIRRYLQDIVIFLRMSRGVDGGITPFATTQFVKLTKFLSTLHGIKFATPSLVALAARKVYPHRILIAKPSRERSIQWGSDIDVIAEMLDSLTPASIIEEVLETVPCPI